MESAFCAIKHCNRIAQRLNVWKPVTWRAPTSHYLVLSRQHTNARFNKNNFSKYGGRNFHDKKQTRTCVLETNKEVVLSPVLSSRKFHTSQKHEFHPVFWLLLKPAAKIASMISGRSFRKWWTKLTDVEKTKFKEKLYQSKGKIAGIVGLLIAAGIINYYTHIQETPVTKRKRYLAFTEEQFTKIAQFELEAQWAALKDDIVDPNNTKARKVYELITKVAQKIVDSNQDLELMRRQKWTVVVVDNDEPNAFVLPTGQIFVFTGILNLTENEDQLAVILGHEIAHVILSHGIEKISIAGLLDVLIIVVMAGIWAFMPSDGIAIVTQWFYNRVMNLLLKLPYSRKLETEADEVGLMLMAKACYDIRESTTFWQKMALLEEAIVKDGTQSSEWVSTHPASTNRATILDKLIPESLKLRECSRCPRLPAKDPRSNIQALRQILDKKKSEAEDKGSSPAVQPPKVARPVPIGSMAVNNTQVDTGIAAAAAVTESARTAAGRTELAAPAVTT